MYLILQRYELMNIVYFAYPRRLQNTGEPGQPFSDIFKVPDALSTPQPSTFVIFQTGVTVDNWDLCSSTKNVKNEGTNFVYWAEYTANYFVNKSERENTEPDPRSYGAPEDDDWCVLVEDAIMNVFGLSQFPYVYFLLFKCLT